MHAIRQVLWVLLLLLMPISSHDYAHNPTNATGAVTDKNKHAHRQTLWALLLTGIRPYNYAHRQALWALLLTGLSLPSTYA